MILKNKKPSNQYVIMFAAFAWFSTFLELNKDVKPEKNLLSLYSKLAVLCKTDDKTRVKIINRINLAIDELSTKDVDYTLLSVCILAEYYEQLKGKKRTYQVMSIGDIVMLQDECIDGIETDLMLDTMDYATAFVEKILKG